MRSRPRLGTLAASLITVASFVCSSAQAGPPLLCFPYQIGEAKSLPWGSDAFEKNKGYDKSKVVNDTLAILKTEKSTLVRMETIRRAVIYIEQDSTIATTLVSRLSSIAMDAEASDKPSAAAWFDAGFLVATLRQGGVGIEGQQGKLVDGYQWVRKALAIEPKNAEMQFGAALVAHERQDASFKDHLRQAIAGAEPGSNLARSIESNYACGHKPLKELAAEYGVKVAEKK